MVFDNSYYEITIVLIINILRVGLLKKVMDSFLAAGDNNQKIRKTAFAVYYFVTAMIYGMCHVSAVYELCNGACILAIACFYRAAWRKKLWISLSFWCMDMGCLLAVYFMCSNEVRGPENAVWILLLLICVLLIGHISDPAEEKEASFDTKQMSLLILIPALCIAAFGSILWEIRIV